MTTLGKSVDSAIDEMPENFELKSFFVENRAEIKDMIMTEFTIDEVYNRASREGREEGIRENRARVASDMLKDGEPIAKILKYSKLSEDTIRSIAHSLGLAVQQ